MSEAGGKRIAVIGAGIVGCSCALFLQRDGHAVTLIDPRPPGTGASLGNAGIISLYSVMPIATPEVVRNLPGMLRDPLSPLAVRWRYLPRLAPWLWHAALAARRPRVEAASRALAALLDRAGQAHDILIQQCGLGDLVRSVGWLKVAYDRDRLMRATALDRAVYERFGRRYEMLGRDEVHDLEPALSPEVEAGMLLAQNRAIRHPQTYVAGVARTFLERGGRHLQVPARDLKGDGRRITAVVTDDGEIATDAVVIAAGAWSRRLARAAGTRVPLESERGYHLMLPHPAPTLNRPVYTVEGAFVLAPMEHGLRLTGGVELASNEAPADYRRIHRLLPGARRLVPGLGERTLSEWQGHRPSLPDSLPVIGRAPRRDNVWFAFGHQHIGLTLGPVTGRLIADLVAGRAADLDLAPFRPDRSYH
jgi:D-amino-acid dehydrogenase